MKTEKLYLVKHGEILAIRKFNLYYEIPLSFLIGVERKYNGGLIDKIFVKTKFGTLIEIFNSISDRQENDEILTEKFLQNQYEIIIGIIQGYNKRKNR